MADPQTDLLQGTLDLLILKTLALGPQHGWGVSQRIQQMSRDALQVNQGSLYPALHRLEHRGWITEPRTTTARRSSTASRTSGASGSGGSRMRGVGLRARSS